MNNTKNSKLIAGMIEKTTTKRRVAPNLIEVTIQYTEKQLLIEED